MAKAKGGQRVLRPPSIPAGVYDARDVTPGEIAQLLRGAESLPRTDARSFMLTAAGRQAPNIVMLAVNGGKLVGSAAFIKENEYIYVGDVGSVEPGQGRNLLRKMGVYASDRGLAIRLYPTVSSNSFWQHMGFHEVTPGGILEMSANEVKEKYG